MIRQVGAKVLQVRSSFWKDHSRLILVRDNAGWAIDVEMKAVGEISRRLGLPVSEKDYWQRHSKRQSIFWGSQFSLLKDDWLYNDHRNATAMFHGLPDTGYPEFDELFSRIEKHRDCLQRVQVTHRAMEESLVNIGLSPDIIHRIPIGIDGRVFRPTSSQTRLETRSALGIPDEAFVVGSFQKDGNGWGEGNEPKWIKGPDLFVEACAKLSKASVNLFVLLSGPARGYVKDGLQQRGIPFLHRIFDRPEDVKTLYPALDAYLVSSRQEGGPNAILESMATGVPIVSTPVGQATDLVQDGVNGLLVPTEDTSAMCDALLKVAREEIDLEQIRKAGFKTAAANDYRAQDPLWKKLFEGFVG
ncbi:MAG: glycosyltransferase [Verrucomicrobiota bacterium]